VSGECVYVRSGESKSGWLSELVEYQTLFECFSGCPTMETTVEIFLQVVKGWSAAAVVASTDSETKAAKVSQTLSM
jgi:hypothetical protein